MNAREIVEWIEVLPVLKYDGDANGQARLKRFRDALVRLIEATYEPCAPPVAPDAERTLRCEKCGGTDIGTAYHKAHALSWYDCSYSSHTKRSSEHLHHTCRTCQWDWCDFIPSPTEPATRGQDRLDADPATAAGLRRNDDRLGVAPAPRESEAADPDSIPRPPGTDRGGEDHPCDCDHRYAKDQLHAEVERLRADYATIRRAARRCTRSGFTDLEMLEVLHAALVITPEVPGEWVGE